MERSELHRPFLPDDAQRRVLASHLANDPALGTLAQKQPDDPSQPKVEVLQDAATGASFPLVPIPIPGIRGALFAGRMPGARGKTRVADEVAAIRRGGIAHVVCLVPGLDHGPTYFVPEYEALARRTFGDGFVLLQVLDYETPRDERAFDTAVFRVRGLVNEGSRVLVHCGMGCGRAGMFAACVLVTFGFSVHDAVRHYRRQRGCGPETPEQVAYVSAFAAKWAELAQDPHDPVQRMLQRKASMPRMQAVDPAAFGVVDPRKPR